MERKAAAPGRIAETEANWLKNALIMTNALDCLQNLSAQGHTLSVRANGKWKYYDNKVIYEYVWVCYNQGFGPRAWKKKPPMPPVRDRGEWFRMKALALEKEITANWGNGVALEEMIELWTPAELLVGPDKLLMSLS